MNLLWRSLKSLVIKNKLVFVLFCLCQVVSILSIIFVYGVIVARAEYNNSFDIGNRQLHIPLEMPIGREELEQKIRLLAEDEQLHDTVEQYSVWMDAGDIRIKADMQYVEASPLFVSFGKYFTPEDFTSDNKVVLICEEIAFGDPSYEVGDTYSVMGESYTIQGIFNSFNTAYVEIPYTSLPSVEGIRRITITLKHPVDGDTAREYGKAIKELWDIVSVELPPASEASDVTENIFQMSGSLLIALLAAINFSALYRFLLRRRQSEYAIYRMYGCTKTKGFLLLFGELLIVGGVLFILSSLIFHFGLSWIYPYMHEGVPYALSLKDYLVVCGLYFLNILIVFTPIIKKYSGSSPVDIYRLS